MICSGNFTHKYGATRKNVAVRMFWQQPQGAGLFVQVQKQHSQNGYTLENKTRALLYKRDNAQALKKGMVPWLCQATIPRPTAVLSSALQDKIGGCMQSKPQ